MPTEELKPVRCGCGGEAWTDYIIGEPSEGVGWFVCCKNCEIQLPPEYDTEAEAITAWNRAMGAKDINVPSKERTAKAEYSNAECAYLCSECGRVVQIEDAFCCGCGRRLEWNE